ncbi:MAG: sensor histidine kinase [Phototrophicaceae bacterium]
MNHNISTHITQMTHYDGMLHWCSWIAVVVLIIWVVWGVYRVLLPLRRLSRLAITLTEGDIPSFAQPVGGIREIEQLRCSLQRMSERIQAGQRREVAFRNRLAEGQEQERLRIAREIHDDTIQTLILVTHSLERATNSIESTPPLLTHITHAREQLIVVINDLRELITHLRPTLLDELGLVAALESLCEQYPQVHFSIIGQCYSITANHALALFRAAQEALRNAQHHAHANEIWVTLTYTQGSVMLDVRDDGVGFNVPNQFQGLAMNGHFGLLGIRERILHLGGSLKISSELQRGTHLYAIVPLVNTPTAA